MISDNSLRHNTSLSQRSTEEHFGTRPISFLPEQHIHHLAMLINRPTEVAFLLAAATKHLIHLPPPPHAPTGRTEGSRQLRAKRLDPGHHGPCRDSETSFGEEFNDMICREGGADIPPHSGQDQVGGLTVVSEGGRRVREEILSTRVAGGPLPLVCIIALALAGALAIAFLPRKEPALIKEPAVV